MSWYSDPLGEEQVGRNAARWGERHDYDHRERMRNAKWDRLSCDAHYARGYKQEIDRQEELRQEERREEERRAQRAREDAQQRAIWDEEEQEEREEVE